ncbi:MAG: dihydroorotate dehydrogenase electron transfer subunit [Chitinophagales bacterium]
MSVFSGKARVAQAGALSSGVAGLWVNAPEIAAVAVPGQFVMVSGGPQRITRRPFGVAGVDRARGEVRLALRVAGTASAWLAGRQAGEEIELHGPLGAGFALPEPGGEAWLAGGGIGAAPLLFLAEALRAQGTAVWSAVGGRTAADVWAAPELGRLGGVAVTTEDGSAGEKGLVTIPLAARLAQAAREPDRPRPAVYACGPRGMLVAVARATLAAGLDCQVSVEERMACGVGACAGCTWPDGRLAEGLALRRVGSPPERGGEGASGHPLRVCRDGPCFWVVSAS